MILANGLGPETGWSRQSVVNVEKAPLTLAAYEGSTTRLVAEDIGALYTVSSRGVIMFDTRYDVERKLGRIYCLVELKSGAIRVASDSQVKSASWSTNQFLSPATLVAAESSRTGLVFFESEGVYPAERAKALYNARLKQVPKPRWGFSFVNFEKRGPSANRTFAVDCLKGSHRWPISFQKKGKEWLVLTAEATKPSVFTFQWHKIGARLKKATRSDLGSGSAATLNGRHLTIAGFDPSTAYFDPVSGALTWQRSWQTWRLFPGQSVGRQIVAPIRERPVTTYFNGRAYCWGYMPYNDGREGLWTLESGKWKRLENSRVGGWSATRSHLLLVGGTPSVWQIKKA